MLTDPPALFALYAGVYCALRFAGRKVAYRLTLGAAAFFGALVREAVLVLALLVALGQQPTSALWRAVREGRWRQTAAAMARAVAVPFAAGAAALVLVRLVGVVDPSVAESLQNYTFLRAALFHFWINSPQYLVTATFANFGLFLVFLLLQPRAVARFADAHPMVLWGAIVTLLLAAVGGYDVERYVNVAWPFVAVLVIKAIEAERPNPALVAGLIAFTAAFVCRVPWITPDYGAIAVSPTPVFTYLTSDLRYLDLFVLHSDKTAKGKIFYENVAAFAVLLGSPSPARHPRRHARRPCRRRFLRRHSVAGKSHLVIIGAGNFAEVAHEYFSEFSDYTVRGFAVERDYRKGDSFRGLPLVALDDLSSQFPPEAHAAFVAVAFTDLNRVRARLLAEVRGMGYRPASFVSPRAFVASSTRLGEHCFVFEGNVIQTGTVIGANVILWSGNHIGHHTVIGDNVFVSSHVVVSGSCRVDAGCFLGVNASVADGIHVGEDCWIGPGAVLTADAAPRTIVRAPKPAAAKGGHAPILSPRRLAVKWQKQGLVYLPRRVPAVGSPTP